jgi:hypothetical protein
MKLVFLAFGLIAFGAVAVEARPQCYAVCSQGSCTQVCIQ